MSYSVSPIYPIKRLLTNLHTGDVDVSLFLMKTNQRTDFIEYTTPLTQIDGKIWLRKESGVEIDSLEELMLYRTSKTMGYTYGSKLDSIFAVMQPVEQYSDSASFELLLANKIDFFACNEFLAKALHKTIPHFTDMFTYAETTFIEWDLYMVISKKSPLISHIDEINEIISELRENGVIDSIIGRYIN